MSSIPLIIICQPEDNSRYAAEIAASPGSRLIPDVGTLKGSENGSVNKVIFADKADLLTSQVLKDLLNLLKPEGQLEIVRYDPNATEFNLKTSGFINVVKTETCITAVKPNYAVGSSVKLSLKKPSLWKLDDDEGDDLIDPDDLLDEDDLKKPDPLSLRVCGTTGKRKACKDCSCGLADELATEAQSGKVVDTTDAPKSSCGSCYLGDAFRCASCPYLGMPAFKPGEKIQLSSLQLKSDI